MKDFNLGKAVYYCHCHGESYGNKPYRWGYVRAGFITDIEYIQARDRYIYTVGTLSPFNSAEIVYKTLGPHLIFEYGKYEEALEKVKELCEEVE